MGEDPGSRKLTVLEDTTSYDLLVSAYQTGDEAACKQIYKSHFPNSEKATKNPQSNIIAHVKPFQKVSFSQAGG